MKRTPLTRKTRLRAKGRKKPPPGRNDAYRKWIRTLPCVISTIGCGSMPGRYGRAEPAHVVGTWGHTRRDVGVIVPLCPKHHEEQEGKTRAFQARYSVDLKAEAARLATEWTQQQEEG